jgi:DNA repair exonuclease SbcCD nuclease subunit
MRFPCLITSDLHFTDQPAAEYRWGLFDWLVTTCKEEKVKTLMILGDLTDQKDKHSAELVNRIVANIRRVAEVVTEVKILVGNHDWQKQGQEFFRFLEVIPNVQYINKPMEDPDVTGEAAYYLPYSKNPAKDWAGLDFSHYRWLFLHQTIAGAVSSNGQEMEGEDLPALNAGKVYSGDIHVPQVVKGVEYVGSPYHVHFGDSFKPRAVLLEHGGRPVDLHFETISRVSVTVTSLRQLYALKLRSRDQIKLTFEMSEAEKHDWQKIKRTALTYLEEQGVEVHGLKLAVKKSARRLLTASNQSGPAYSPAQAVERFVGAEELGGEALDAAMEVLES